MHVDDEDFGYNLSGKYSAGNCVPFYLYMHVMCHVRRRIHACHVRRRIQV